MQTQKTAVRTFCLWVSSLFVLTLLGGCIGRPPLRTYTLARTAVESAKKYDGAKVAPQDFHQAEESYRRGEYYFRNRDYPAAAAAFEDAIEFAEKAENKARLSPKKEN